MNQTKGNLPPDSSKMLTEAQRQKLFEMINSVRYGSVTLIIQDGRVVQIDKNEKLRLT